MKIRPMLTTDFDAVVKILVDGNVEPPLEPSDMFGGVSLVAENDGEILGCIHAMHGGGTMAYGDFYAAKTTRSAWLLLQHLETCLRLRGVKRIMFNTEKGNTEFDELARKYGCEKLRELTYWRREL